MEAAEAGSQVSLEASEGLMLDLLTFDSIEAYHYFERLRELAYIDLNAGEL